MKIAIPANYKLLLFIAMGTLIIATSCVSKRKYVEITNQKVIAEKKVADLSADYDILKSDYQVLSQKANKEEEARQKLIDSLKSNNVTLTNNMLSENDNIKDQTFSYQVENVKLSQLLAEKDKEIRNLTRDINTLKVQVDDLYRGGNKSKPANGTKALPDNQMEKKILSKDKEIASLDSMLNSAKQEILLLKEKITSQSLLIEKLNSSKDSTVKVLEK